MEPERSPRADQHVEDFVLGSGLILGFWELEMG